MQRLSQTLEDFLRFAKVERSQLRPTDVNDVAAQVAEFVGPELDRAGITLTEQYAHDMPPCPADERLLKQAILNIILNAQQAMPNGGEIILRTSTDNGGVTVEIIDTGPGISKPVRDKVFDPFYSTKKDGSGLGLALTKRIIDQHGGTVRFVSEPGKGTDFSIRIPSAQSPENSQES